MLNAMEPGSTYALVCMLRRVSARLRRRLKALGGLPLGIQGSIAGMGTALVVKPLTN
jgi:hypothetical protein